MEMCGWQQAQVRPTPTHSGRPSLGRQAELHRPASPASPCCCGSPGLDRHTRPWRKLDCNRSFLPILGVGGRGRRLQGLRDFWERGQIFLGLRNGSCLV